MANFGPKPWTNPYGKNSIFSTFSTSCFYSLERRFIAIEYHQTHFPGLHCFKKRTWTNGQFWTKTMDQPLWKKLNFLTYSTSCFYSLKRHFSLENIIKHIFLTYIPPPKKDQKIANFGPKPWTNPFGKNSIFRLSQHLVFIA